MITDTDTQQHSDDFKQTHSNVVQHGNKWIFSCVAQISAQRKPVSHGGSRTGSDVRKKKKSDSKVLLPDLRATLQTATVELSGWVMI